MVLQVTSRARFSSRYRVHRRSAQVCAPHQGFPIQTPPGPPEAFFVAVTPSQPTGGPPHMAKRSRDIAHARMPEATVEPLFRSNWHPLAGERDHGREQSYVRTVRPQSEAQRALVAAMEAHHLTLAP